MNILTPCTRAHTHDSYFAPAGALCSHRARHHQLRLPNRACARARGCTRCELPLQGRTVGRVGVPKSTGSRCPALTFRLGESACARAQAERRSNTPTGWHSAGERRSSVQFGSARFDSVTPPKSCRDSRAREGLLPSCPLNLPLRTVLYLDFHSFFPPSLVNLFCSLRTFLPWSFHRCARGKPCTFSSRLISNTRT